MRKFLSKQRKAAAATPITKQATQWQGTMIQTPGRALRNTTFVYDFDKKPDNTEYAPWVHTGQMGVKAPERKK